MRRSRLSGLIGAGLLLVGCAGSKYHPVRVVASTTLIGSVVAAVGGDRFAVTTIMPAGICPGHFDLQPSHVVAASQARLIINHGWETWLPRLRAATENPSLRVVTVKTAGNWMLPAVHKEAVLEICDLLSRTEPASAGTFRLRAGRYRSQIDSASALAQTLLADRLKPAALASEHQAGFLVWLGFDTVASYGRPEDITARELVRLARLGLGSDVGIVVDNLQSGPDAGLDLARSIGARHVNLSNFPLECSYIDALLANAKALAAVLDENTPDTLNRSCLP